MLADVTRTGAVDTRFEILAADGTPIGTILTLTLSQGGRGKIPRPLRNSRCAAAPPR